MYGEKEVAEINMESEKEVVEVNMDGENCRSKYGR